VTDRELAEEAVRLAGGIALRRAGETVGAAAKDAPTDVVSEVDREAEAAIAALIAAERPEDGIEGEEGTTRPGERRWVIDALDGTLNYVNGLPGWCAAVALEGVAAAVYDPVRDELFTSGDGARLNGRPIAVRDADSLDAAVVATFLHQPKKHLPGVVPTLTRVLEEAGSVRITGSGTLELAYVAAGRLNGWIQPATFTWDWLPGAHLVTEAGGVATRVPGATEWFVAGAPKTAAALEELVRAR
jgi:myo-inositol-1(or 4)-monophosphatase